MPCILQLLLSVEFVNKQHREASMEEYSKLIKGRSITLKLTLKKKWFDMISSGEKKEEYREIKPYWIKRLKFDIWNVRPFLYVEFRNGYMKDSPRIKVELKKIMIGKGREEWGAEQNKEYYILHLGDVVKF